MKSPDVIFQYQDVFSDTTKKIEELNRIYCMEFNDSLPKVYHQVSAYFLVGDNEYIILGKATEMHSGISVVEMKNLSLQQHFNYLSAIARDIEMAIFDKLIRTMSPLGKKEIAHKDLSIVMNIENNSTSFIVNQTKDFVKDMTTDEQLDVYYRCYNKAIDGI
jgi:hypothetical protein